MLDFNHQFMPVPQALHQLKVLHIFSSFLQRHHCFVSFTSDRIQTVEVVFISTHPSDPRENQLTEHMEHSLSTKFITIKLGEL